MLSEPDAYSYVQSAALVGNRVQLDFTNDPPPDIVAEVDINHDSLSKFPFHAALGMTEIWRYDGQTMTITFERKTAEDTVRNVAVYHRAAP